MEIENPPQTPLSHKGISHYYGDTIRLLFVAAALLYAIAMPLWGDPLPFGTLPGIAVILILAFLAGITNPHSGVLMFLNVLVSGAGVFFLQAAAVWYFDLDPILLFMIREIIAIVLIFAFYYSVKSLRNMMVGKIGAAPKPGEFEKKSNE